MNKELMIKAAVQFKGVWPEEEETHLYKFYNGGFVTGMAGGTADVVCTREQFEDFVESLFDGAPDNATHVGEDGLFYKIGDNSAQYWNFSDKWAQDVNGKDWLSKNLIPRPAKKAPIIGDTLEQLKRGVKPQGPYIPKADTKCLGNIPDSVTLKYSYTEVIPLRDLGVEWVVQVGEGGSLHYCDEFRPLSTERELFIEQATKDYLDQVGSDAVNSKWFERIFGALYDKDYRKRD